MIYFTSDWHFNHDKDFIWKSRGFDNVHEMNNVIMERHNEIVRPEDTVYVLGDLCMGGGSDEILRKNRKMIQSMKGNLKVIIGNHDTSTRLKMYGECYNVEILGYAHFEKINKYNLYMSHYPSFTGNLDYDKPLKARVINIFGHTHSDELFYEDNPLMYNVAVDAHNCYPVPLEKVIEDIQIGINATPEITKKVKDIRPYIKFLDKIMREGV